MPLFKTFLELLFCCVFVLFCFHIAKHYLLDHPLLNTTQIVNIFLNYNVTIEKYVDWGALFS